MYLVASSVLYEVTLNANLLVEPTITAKRWRIHRSISQSPSKWLRMCLARSSYCKALGTVRFIAKRAREQEQAATTTQITRVTQHTARHTSHYSNCCVPTSWISFKATCNEGAFLRFFITILLLVKCACLCDHLVSNHRSDLPMHISFPLPLCSVDPISGIHSFITSINSTSSARNREEAKEKCRQKTMLL